MKKISVVVLSLLLVLCQSHAWVVVADDVPVVQTPDPQVAPVTELPPDTPPPLSEPTPADPVTDPLPVAPVDPLPDPLPPVSDPVPDPIPELPPAPLPDPTDFIFINEILADPDGDDATGEFIELYNAGISSVDLSGWRLDDARADDGHYDFLNKAINYVLDPGSYMVLYRPETKIVLNNDKDTVTLFDPMGKVIDSFAYGQQVSGHSIGRNPEKIEEWMTFKTITPGALNFMEPNGIPFAVIDIQQDTRYMKLNVTGDNSSDPDGDPLGFLWDFGDGFFDVRSNPLIHEYQSPGSKLVRLTVTDPRGASAQSEITFEASPQNVVIGSPPVNPFPPSEVPNESAINHPPIPVIDIQKDTNHMKLNVTGENSSDPDGDELTYLWEYEEGVFDERENPLIYEYQTAGSKLVTLTVTDSRGASSKAQINFEASPAVVGGGGGSNPPPAPEALAENHPPLAVIDIQKDTGTMKLNMTGENSSDPDHDKLTYLWDFGDGTSDNRSNPLIHEYQTAGVKHVLLTVTDSHGAFGTAEISFSAQPKGSGASSSSAKHFPRYLLINEVLPAPAGKDDEHEWMELYNENSYDIDLSGWYLDDAEGKSSPYRIPDDTFLLAHSYLLFSAPDLKLSFNNSADVVRLLDPNKELSQQISYSDPKENWSFARADDGSFQWTSMLTPEQANQFSASAKLYQTEDVMVEKVLPNPEGKDAENEKIILKNQTSTDVSLLGWTMADATGSKKQLPDILLSAGSDITLAASDLKLSLNNSDEELTLFDPSGTLINQVKWKTSVSGQWLLNSHSLKDGLTAQVLRVIDGDTFVIHYDDKNLTIRLLGINTPETVHPFKPVEYFGKEASQFLSQTLTGQTVTLQFDGNRIDKYDRLLAYVYLNDEMVNREILKQGFGYVYTRFPFKFLEDFVDIQKHARESRVGLWQNLKVDHFFDQLIQAKLDEKEEVPEDFLIPLRDELASDPKKITLPKNDEPTILLQCSSDFLKIKSFLPNPQKGMSVEQITLANLGSQNICLNGWVLDDKLNGGSKPFTIKGGAIAPNGVRTFRKQETKLSLNNTNDCVNLLAPGGLLMDQICYEKTHKNEFFTHTGGDWVPKPKVKKSHSKKTSKKSRFSFQRDLLSYQSDLPTVSYVGKITSVDDKNKLITLELESSRTVIVSYANSPVNMIAARELIDFNNPVQVKVYESSSSKNLLSIQPAPVSSEISQKLDDHYYVKWIILLFGALLLSASPFLYGQWLKFYSRYF